jgi:drug/metabolite transporter (DMT)-like permease
MWQLYAIGALLSDAVKRIADKAAVASAAPISSTVAAFYRTAAFLLFVGILGVSGIFGPIVLAYTWHIFFIAALYILSSIGYSHLLQRIEISSTGALSYAVPFLLLFSDHFLLGTAFTLASVAGVLLITFGGAIFAIDPQVAPGIFSHRDRHLPL